MEMSMGTVLSAADPLLNSIVASQTNPYLRPLPFGYDTLSAISIQDNLAVIPGHWETGHIKSAFYKLHPEDVQFSEALERIKSVDFVAWDESFFDLVLGPEAVLERIVDFPDSEHHVHEAPVYIPETGELLFCDTSVIGTLFAVNVKDGTYQTRSISTNPPLHNINGGTYFNGTTYFLTNGSPVRGIYTVDHVSGATAPVVNNYRGRHLNSPNDIVVDSRSDLWFTDPAYGWYQDWSGVQIPELPNSIYFFNRTSKALKVMSNSVVGTPNGLAFSSDESTLYISDSSTTTGKPIRTPGDGIRNIWAFGVHRSETSAAPSLHNPRLVYQTETGWPDGIRVTENDLLIITVAGGADIVDPQSGVLLGKINTPGDILYNVEPIPGMGTWFLTGQKHIYKVEMREKALESIWTRRREQ